MGKVYHTTENPFKVPSDYFQDLEDRIEEKLQKTEDSSAKASFIQIIKPYLWLTSVLVGIFIFTNILLDTSVDPDSKIIEFTQSISLEQDVVTGDDIIEYLTDTDIDPDIIISRLSNDE